jgi:AcrR family transcriptional regulator
VAGPGHAEAKGRGVGRFADERLPRGRHRLSVTAVAENQRWRLLAAAADVFYEHGYLGTTSKRIAASAGVSSRAFYRYFDDVSDCLHAAFDVAADALTRALVGRCQDARDRRDRARSATEALLAFYRSEPQLTSLLGTELSAAEKEIAARRWRLIGRLGALLSEREGERDPGRGTALDEHLVAASLALSCNRGGGQPPVSPDLAAQLPALVELAGSAP